MAAYSHNLPEGWWDDNRFHLAGHQQWCANKFGENSVPAMFLTELTAAAHTVGMKWVDMTPGAIRHELYDWNDAPNLDFDHFFALNRLFHAVDQATRAKQPEPEPPRGIQIMAHESWGQF